MNVTSATPPASAAAGLELTAGHLRLALRPDLGGSIAGLWLGAQPVLRSTEPAALGSARASGCFPLLPYSNRLGYRRFDWKGRAYTTTANFGDDYPHSVHGVAWLQPWAVGASGADFVELQLTQPSGPDWPFGFHAVQRFELTPGALRVQLTLTNIDARNAPVGLGWHPYFPKRGHSRLHLALSHRWDSGADQLPVRRVAQAGIAGDVSELHFDHCFDGWHGAAQLRDEALDLRITSSLDRVVVYTPQDKPYYCVEPVSHVSNAVNLPEPTEHGLASVPPGESVSAWMQIDVAPA
jgi:aldose 1-epimerase